MANKHRWLLIGLAVLGLSIRYGFIYAGTARSGLRPAVMDDDGDNINFGRQLYLTGEYIAPKSNGMWVRAWRPPLFGLWTAGIFKLHGYDSFLAERIYTATFSMLVPLLIFIFCRSIWNESVGLIGYFWGLFHPSFIYYSAVVQCDSVFLIISTIAMVLLMLQNSYKVALTAGVFSALACMGRSQFGAVAGLNFLWIFFLAPGERRRMRAMFFATGFIFTMSFWWVRNYRVFHQIVPATTEGGYTLWVGNNPLADGGGDCPTWAPVPKDLNELERDRWYYKEAFQYMKENPRRTFDLALSKISRYWGIVPRVGGWKLKILSFLAYFPMFILALWGFWISRQRLRLVAPIFGMLLFYSCCHLIFPAIMRYRLPLEPFLIALASAGLWGLISKETFPARS